VKKSFDENYGMLSSPDMNANTLSPEPGISALDKDSEMHYHLGIAYKEMELFDYAITEFELASSSPTMQFDCYIMLGNCYMEKGDYNKSIEYYKMSSKIQGLTNERLARLHFNLGLAYEANGMISEAIETFNLVLKLDHSFTEAEEKIKKLQTP
jgi:tetratricopeptide (TPR) repeat protein